MGAKFNPLVRQPSAENDLFSVQGGCVCLHTASAGHDGEAWKCACQPCERGLRQVAEGQRSFTVRQRLWAVKEAQAMAGAAFERDDLILLPDHALAQAVILSWLRVARRM